MGRKGKLDFQKQEERENALSEIERGKCTVINGKKGETALLENKRKGK